MENEVVTTPPKEREKCNLCGLEQPVEGMAVDYNGRYYCHDRTQCWQTWSKQNGFEREVK